MRPDTLAKLLDYLRGLGERHTDIKTSVIQLDFSGLNYDRYPALVVEPDPFVEGSGEGANLYRVAFQVLLKPGRNDAAPDVALTDRAQQLADELLQQMLREQLVEQAKNSNHTFVLIYGTANEGMDSGVRCELSVLLPKAINRITNPNKFISL